MHEFGLLIVKLVDGRLLFFLGQVMVMETQDAVNRTSR
jgi:hypothetical protein